MKALILRKDVSAAVSITQALIDKGFQVLCVESQAVAHALIRLDTYDLLVMDERIEGQLTHAIALSGERRNPYLSAIMLTDRTSAETDDLYALIPALYALAGHDISTEMLTPLAMAAIIGRDVMAARVAETEVEDVADDVIVPDDVLVLDESCAALADERSVADLPVLAPLAQSGIASERPLERMEDVVLRQVAALFGKDAMPFAQAAPAMQEPPLLHVPQ